MSKTLLGYIALTVGLAAAGLGLAAGGHSSPAHGGRVSVVAAENFYGDIVSQIGGSHVAVTSVLSDPNADPHLFEPGTRVGLSVSQAALVIQNGVGYDSFMQKLEDAAPSTHRIVVTIADVLGVTGANQNPHLWYDVPKLGRIGSAIASGLGRADPAHRRAYRAGLVRFERSLGPLRREVAAIRARYGGTPVAYTEPVAGYLLAAAGLRSLTPEPFARAIEDGSEPSPEAVAQMTALFTGRRVRVLLVNTQTVSPITTRIRSAAEAAGIPVIGVSETMPPGQSFAQWQLDQAQALERALRR